MPTVAPPIEDLPDTTGFGDGLMLSQPDCGTLYEPDPTCCQGEICEQCFLEVTPCHVAWSCPENVTSSKLYIDDVLISEDPHGIIGLPENGVYRLDSSCGDLDQTISKELVDSGLGCTDCCNALGLGEGGGTLVLTVSGFPGQPAWSGANGSFVLDPAPGFPCQRSADIILDVYANCIGPAQDGSTGPAFLGQHVATFSVSVSFILSIAHYYGQLIVGQSLATDNKSAFGGGTCQPNFSSGGQTRTYNNPSCGLPISGTFTFSNPNSYLGVSFSSYFGSGTSNFTIDWKLDLV